MKIKHITRKGAKRKEKLKDLKDKSNSKPKPEICTEKPKEKKK